MRPVRIVRRRAFSVAHRDNISARLELLTGRRETVHIPEYGTTKGARGEPFYTFTKILRQ
jgi:hypothetical protein